MFRSLVDPAGRSPLEISRVAPGPGGDCHGGPDLSPDQQAMPDHAELETFCSKVGCLCSKFALSPPFQIRALAAGWAADGIPLARCLGTIEDYLTAHAAKCQSGASDRLFRWVDMFLRGNQLSE
jgi:hypothetical protein